MSWKYLTSRQLAEILGVFWVLGVYPATKPQIVGWAVSGKRLEIVSEV